ncbi:MAG: flagellar motor protein [Methylomicrobium sp.]
MDYLSIVGVVLGFAAIVGGSVIEGAQVEALFNGPALLIVLGGTLGATLLQFPPSVFLRSVKISLWVFKPKKPVLRQQVKKVADWSALARKEGLLGLEVLLDREKDPFAIKGLQLLVDGSEPQVIRDCLELDVNIKEYSDLQAAKLFEAMGGYSPTIGIIGAVIGLIHVMKNLADPALLGTGIATAFVATIYGVGFANLIFLPIANKLKMQIHAISQAREMLLEGIVAIAEGENPRNIELKLSSFLIENGT